MESKKPSINSLSLFFSLIIVLTFYQFSLGFFFVILPCCMTMTLTGNTLNSFFPSQYTRVVRHIKNIYRGIMRERERNESIEIALQYLRTQTLC